MIKCPHCGSTAQPKQIGEISDNGRYFCKVYTCGCGCTFEVLFPREGFEEYVIWYLNDK